MKLKRYGIAILFLLAASSLYAAQGDKVAVDLTQAPDQPFMLIATIDSALDAKKTEAILTNFERYPIWLSREINVAPKGSEYKQTLEGFEYKKETSELSFFTKHKKLLLFESRKQVRFVLSQSKKDGILTINGSGRGDDASKNDSYGFDLKLLPPQASGQLRIVWSFYFRIPKGPLNGLIPAEAIKRIYENRFRKILENLYIEQEDLKAIAVSH